jgi:hypothetical protein
MRTTKFKPGDEVLAHVYGGRVVRRVVVADRGDQVVICTREEFDAARTEERDADGVGFPAEDVEPASDLEAVAG